MRGCACSVVVPKPYIGYQKELDALSRALLHGVVYEGGTLPCQSPCLSYTTAALLAWPQTIACLHRMA